MILILLGSHAWAATWVVALDGTGDYKAVSDALWAASPYDTVLVEPGVYGPSTGEDLPWYLPTGVIVEGAGAEVTVFDAEGEARIASVLTPGVTIASVSFYHATGGAVFVDSHADALLREVWFVENSSEQQAAGLLGGGASVVEECVFLHNRVSDPNGVTSLTGSSVYRSTFRDDVKGVQYSVYGGSTGSEFDANTVYGGNVRLDGAITNSVFLGLMKSQNGICLNASVGPFDNNTVVGCEGDVAVVTNIARNNLVAFNAGAGIEAGQAVANLVWDNDGGDWSGTDWTGTLGNLSTDPLFRDFSDDGDWTNDDLRLATGSPAIDAAAPDYPPYDHNGVPRPQDGNGDGIFRADIGAYEWGLIDEDGDGWYLDGGDCDDTDPDINPGVEDIPYNGIDEDCDGSDLIDVDGDGHDADHQGGDDCDDTDADVHPGAWDIPNNGIDEDCDGEDAVDSDGDGWPDDQDCDPYEPSIHPGAEERCNGLDDDCDGDIDEDDVCTGWDTGEDVRTCGCGCRGGDDTGTAWLILALPLWLGRRRWRRAATRTGAS